MMKKLAILIAVMISISAFAKKTEKDKKLQQMFDVEIVNTYQRVGSAWLTIDTTSFPVGTLFNNVGEMKVQIDDSTMYIYSGSYEVFKVDSATNVIKELYTINRIKSTVLLTKKQGK